MGVTIKCKKTGREIDLGCGGFMQLRRKVAQLMGEPFYNHYDENGEFIGSSVDTDLSDLLDEAGVEVRDDG